MTNTNVTCDLQSEHRNRQLTEIWCERETTSMESTILFTRENSFLTSSKDFAVAEIAEIAKINRNNQIFTKNNIGFFSSFLPLNGKQKKSKGKQNRSTSDLIPLIFVLFYIISLSNIVKKSFAFALLFLDS